MSEDIECAFPGGYESDGGSDEWDIGYSYPKNNSDSEVNASVASPDQDNVSALKRAINTGDVQLVGELLDSGMDVETRLGFGWTPLICAAHVANYELVKMLLEHGASADFSIEHFTVLMAACTAKSGTEDDIAKCVDLLLNHSADPNIANRFHTTCLMMASRDGHTQAIDLLVSHGAEVNLQDDGGHTALTLAVHYGHERAVLKLLHLGADKHIKTKAGKTAADFAKEFKHTQISRILASSGEGVNGNVFPKADSPLDFVSKGPNPPAASREKPAELCDIELLLHGLNLEYLSDIMLENDISWSYLLTMEREDLEKIGVTDPEDQQRVLSAVKDILLDHVDLDTLSKLENIDSGSVALLVHGPGSMAIGSEELYNFLISLKQQCCYLTETVQDVNRRFPRNPSMLVLSCDPKKEAQAICTELVAQTGDLQKEVACLWDLLRKMDPAGNPCQLPLPRSHGNWRRRVMKRLALGMLTVGLVFLFSRARNLKVFF